MGSFYQTRLRPRIKAAARRIGIRPGRARANARLPADFDELTARTFEAVREFTMTSPERIHEVVSAVRYVVSSGIDGALVECGVWRGGSAMAMALTLKALGDTRRDLYLYDTFAGMTAPTRIDVSADGDDAERKFAERRLSDDTSEWCRAPLDDVERNLAKTGYPSERIHLVQGKVEDTLPARRPSGPIAILRLDTDWYESTRHELEHLYPLLARGGALILDDYGYWAGARRAVDEYAARNGLGLFLARTDAAGRIAIKP